MRRTIIAVETDKHGGSQMGLLNPETVLYLEDRNGDTKKYSPTLTDFQEYLWDLREHNLQRLVEIAHGDDIYFIDLGDQCHGNKHPDLLVSNRISDQFSIAEYNWQPVYQIPNLKAVRMYTGTGAHNFGFGAAEYSILNFLTAKYPNMDTKLSNHGSLTVNGYKTDCAHHGPYPGSRDWLRGNVARYYLRDLMYQEMDDGKTPPNGVFRGHYHTDCHEYLEKKGYVSELWVVPSYCGMNEHSMQATRSAHKSTFGMLVLEIVDGVKVNEHRLYDTIDIRTEEVL